MNIEHVWQDYQQALKSFLHTKIENKADIDDLMQEIFIKTYQNLHLVKDISKVKSWLFQVANNTIIDFYRARAKQQNQTETSQILAETEQVKHDLMNCLAPFIQNLPQEQQALLIAVDLENEEQKALAEKMGVSYSTLKSRVQSSRKALRALFDECCHFEFDYCGKAIDYHRKPEFTKF